MLTPRPAHIAKPVARSKFPGRGWLSYVRPAPAVLLSFCNVWPAGFSRAVVDPNTSCFSWLPAADWRFDGTDGLRRGVSQAYWSLEQRYGGQTFLASFEASGGLSSCRKLAGISDGHDVLEIHEGLFVVDTGHDRVVELNRSDFSATSIWSASGSMDDTQHVNSISVLDGALFATAFGPRPAKGWREARDGYIVDCRSGVRVVEGIAHPHSLVSHGGSLWWCESATSTVFRFRPGVDAAPVAFARLEGYLRGLAVNRSHVLVAASATRTTSKHLGHSIPIPKEAHPVFEATLFVIDRLAQKTRAVSLGALGAEVFAIEFAGPQIARPTHWTSLDAARDRVLAAAALSAPTEQHGLQTEE